MKEDAILILLSAFSGGLFAGIWSDHFESKRRLRELRRDKYIDHRNTIVQIEHELIPLRVNMSRNLRTLEASFDHEDNVIRLMLRFYKLFLSSGLSLKILSIDIINDYSNLYSLIETINSDTQYLEEEVNAIMTSLKDKEVNESLLDVYSVHIGNLQKKCKKADILSLDLLSKVKIIIDISDKKVKSDYLKSGGEIYYDISKQELAEENRKTIKEETPIVSDEGTQFVAPYADVIKPVS